MRTWKYVLKHIAHRNIRSGYSGYITTLPPHIRIIQAPNDFADMKGQFQEKEKSSTTKLKTFFSKTFFDVK